MTTQNPEYKYIYGSRMLTHIVFWAGYYIFFSLLWAKGGNYYASFGLELILMPIRIGTSYLTIYWLIPKYLLNDQLRQFGFFYLAIMIIAGILQRVLTYFFYEVIFVQEQSELWEISGIIRSIVLINSTVLLLSALKIYDYWRQERAASKKNSEEVFVIRSDKRNFRVKPSDILYVEGLGNYVTFYLVGKKPIISYLKLKELESTLPDKFMRVHKSFIVNRDKIQSYSSENIDINDRMIPLGKSVNLEKLNIK
ncbi:MAG: LytTR family DNA-binding domain-containing protein [Bacteroidota bacterium]